MTKLTRPRRNAGPLVQTTACVSCVEHVSLVSSPRAMNAGHGKLDMCAICYQERWCGIQSMRASPCKDMFTGKHTVSCPLASRTTNTSRVARCRFCELGCLAARSSTVRMSLHALFLDKICARTSACAMSSAAASSAWSLLSQVSAAVEPGKGWHSELAAVSASRQRR